MATAIQPKLHLEAMPLPPRDDVSEAESLLARGRELYKKGADAEAKECFLKALEAAPDSTDALPWLARLAYRSFDWPELARLTATYLARKPGDSELILLRARACNHMKDWSEGASCWARVCENRPSWTEAWFQLARARARAGDHAGALAAADNLVRLDPKDADSLVLLTRILIDLGDLMRGRATFESLVRTDTQRALAACKQFLQDEDARGTAIALRSLLDHDGGNAGLEPQVARTLDVLFRRAVNHERSGALEEAYADYTAVLILVSDERLAHRGAQRIIRVLRASAQEFLKADELERARDAFRRVLRCLPYDQEALFSLGRALVRLKDWSAATPLWRQVAEARPDLFEAHLQLARALDRSGHFGEAARAWQVVLQRDPAHVEATSAFSTIVRRAVLTGRGAILDGRYLDAWRVFGDLQQIDPDNEETQRRLGQIGRNLLKEMRLAYKAGDFNVVLRDAQAASELLLQSSEVQLLIGRAAMQLRQYELALSAWRRFAELEESAGAMPHLQLARCHLRLRQAEPGRRAAMETLARDPENTEARSMLAQFNEM